MPGWHIQIRANRSLYFLSMCIMCAHVKKYDTQRTHTLHKSTHYQDTDEKKKFIWKENWDSLMFQWYEQSNNFFFFGQNQFKSIQNIVIEILWNWNRRAHYENKNSARLSVKEIELADKCDRKRFKDRDKDGVRERERVRVRKKNHRCIQSMHHGCDNLPV